MDNLFREAGLPHAMPDTGGETQRYNQEIGVVRAVYPELMCVDIQPQSGGMIYKAQLADNTLPEVHIDQQRPSYVEFWHRGGNLQDVWCRQVHWRSFAGPETAGAEEKRYYHKHLKIERRGDITIRITRDNRYFIMDSEIGDFIEYDQNTREVKVIAPHVFIGTTDQTRIQYDRADQIREVTPKWVMGLTGLPDTDGITYLQNNIIHLMSNVIKLTAQSAITLDPPRLNFGNANATEHVMLGDAFMALYNAFITLFNSHSHSNVQSGPSNSGPPTASASPMTSAQLSDIAFISKTGL